VDTLLLQENCSSDSFLVLLPCNSVIIIQNVQRRANISTNSELALGAQPYKKFHNMSRQVPKYRIAVCGGGGVGKSA